MTRDLFRTGLLLLILAVCVGGCVAHAPASSERPATLIQRKLIESRSDADAIVWYIALRNAEVEEDPRIWVKTASDGSYPDLIRMMSFQAVAERFLKKADVRTVNARLGIESWWSPTHFAHSDAAGGTFQSSFRPPEGSGIYAMKLPGDPPKERDAVERDFIWLAIAPEAPVEDVRATVRGEKTAKSFNIAAVGVPLHFGPMEPEDTPQNESQ